MWTGSGGLYYVLQKASKMVSNLSKGDTVVIIAGANNISDTTVENPSSDIIGTLWKFDQENHYTNVIFVTTVTTPTKLQQTRYKLHRHDLAWDSLINKAIYKVNY